jgi:hypothetical protein
MGIILQYLFLFRYLYVQGKDDSVVSLMEYGSVEVKFHSAFTSLVDRK